MGYQESHIVVDDLAEASGIIRAMEESPGHRSFYVFGAERSNRDLHYGDPYGCNKSRPLEKCRLIPKGTLVVAVGGDRNPYQFNRDMRFIDGIVENDTVGYWACFDRIPQEELNGAALENPRKEQQAYEQMRRYLEHVWDKHPWDLPDEQRYCRVDTVAQAKKDRKEAERKFPYLARSSQGKG